MFCIERRAKSGRQSPRHLFPIRAQMVSMQPPYIVSLNIYLQTSSFQKEWKGEQQQKKIRDVAERIGAGGLRAQL